jgi:hypothetical protein
VSNNDLRCSKCNSQHHPMDCPRDKELGRPEKKNTIDDVGCGTLEICRKEGYNQAHNEWEAFLAQESKWIKCSDNEPYSGKYLVLTTEYGIQIGWRDTRYTKDWYNDSESYLCVTHWMPLPDKPRGE